MAELSTIPGLRGQIAKTHWKMRTLAIWQAFWPLMAVIAVYGAAAAGGVLERLDAKVAAMMALTFWVAIGITAVRGLYRFTAPSKARAQEALDLQSDLRPLQALTDRPARPDPTGQALWRAHQEHLSDAARRLRVPSFDAEWQIQDPFRLRWIAPVLLIGVLALNLGQLPARFAVRSIRIMAA